MQTSGRVEFPPKASMSAKRDEFADKKEEKMIVEKRNLQRKIEYKKLI